MRKDEILDSLGGLPKISTKGLITNEKNFTYRKKGVKEPLNLRVSGEIKDKVERHSHHSGYSMNEIVEAILEKYYEGKEFEPITKKQLVI
ncbi:MAG: hypothetical protein V4585_21455 [Bacteroidota bacterium]